MRSLERRIAVRSTDCPRCGCRTVELTLESRESDRYRCTACDHEWGELYITLRPAPDRRAGKRSGAQS